MPFQDPEKKQIIIDIYRKRAGVLQRNANAVLMLILFSLIFGIIVFIYAGQITNSGFSEDLEKDLMTSRHQNQILLNQYDSLVQSNERIANIYRSEEMDLLKNRIFLDSLQAFEIRGLHELVNITMFYDRTSKALNDYHNYFLRLNEKIDTLKLENTSMSRNLGLYINDKVVNRNYSLLYTTATRIGATLILIFLVQILINLYRYNIKLASYYDARADALLISTHEEGFLKIINLISPENIDFGKAIRTPAQHAVDLAKEIISKSGSK